MNLKAVNLHRVKKFFLKGDPLKRLRHEANCSSLQGSYCQQFDKLEGGGGEGRAFKVILLSTMMNPRRPTEK